MAVGRVAGIYITRSTGLPMTSLDEVAATAGRGLEGDRYATGLGFYSDKPEPGRHVTFIAAEAIRALEDATGIHLQPGEYRRNVVTEGVPLDELIGREFTVGSTRLYGVKPCVPCVHITQLTGQPGLLEALVGRGGLRTEIVASGVIRVGDAVRPA